MWNDCFALVEELELRGEVTEAEGAVLRKLAEDRFAPLGTLFKASCLTVLLQGGGPVIIAPE